MSLQLGQTMRDKITGFQGIAVTRVEYLYGCMQFGLAPKVNDKGEIGDTQFFDWQRLEIADSVPLVLPEPQMHGGINRDAPKR